MENLHELKTEDLKALLVKDTFIILDFYAIWCPPCIMLGKTIKTLAKEYEGKITFIKINIDKHKDIANAYHVKSIPTLIGLRNEQELFRVSGFKTRGHLQAMFDGLFQE
ncbi:MAG: thioredoxin [Clostridia bacterium]|nr:thioredoxin [Erysipelotrichia bacterium]NCC88038.1 thioredoxin [Clostridia bacterium]